LDFAELQSNLLFFDDWADRYQYIIGLGSKLPPLPEAYRTEKYKVQGCLSQVWLQTSIVEDEDGRKRLEFNADSDSSIVKGLFAVLRSLFSGKTPDEILAVDLDASFASIGLAQHLSPNRRNGFYSMIEEMKRAALVVRSLG
jgi:cysteine desulfuration protein SufE